MNVCHEIGKLCIHCANNIPCRYQSSDASSTCSPLAYGPDSIQPQLDSTEVHRLCTEYRESMELSLDEIRQIEEDTRDQGDDISGLWLCLRRPRLTSSNFGVVCKRRSTTPVANLVKNLLYRSASNNASSL